MRRAIVSLLAAMLLAGCGSAPDSGSSEGTFHGTRLGDPFTAPATELTDTDGAAYSLAEGTTEPLTLVFFGYTNCPDICEMVMSNVASALTRLDETARGDVDVVFVTTDPARDDAATLRSYLDRFDPGFLGLTGELEAIVGIGDDLGVFVDRGKELETGGYDVTHTDHLFVIDGDDEVPVIWKRETSAAELAADLAVLLEDA